MLPSIRHRRVPRVNQVFSRAVATIGSAVSAAFVAGPAGTHTAERRRRGLELQDRACGGRHIPLASGHQHVRLSAPDLF